MTIIIPFLLIGAAALCVKLFDRHRAAAASDPSASLPIYLRYDPWQLAPVLVGVSCAAAMALRSTIIVWARAARNSASGPPVHFGIVASIGLVDLAIFGLMGFLLYKWIRPDRIKLDMDGIEICSLGRTHAWSWRQIAGVELKTIREARGGSHQCVCLTVQADGEKLIGLPRFLKSSDGPEDERTVYELVRALWARRSPNAKIPVAANETAAPRKMPRGPLLLLCFGGVAVSALFVGQLLLQPRLVVPAQSQLQVAQGAFLPKSTRSDVYVFRTEDGRNLLLACYPTGMVRDCFDDDRLLAEARTAGYFNYHDPNAPPAQANLLVVASANGREILPCAERKKALDAWGNQRKTPGHTMLFIAISLFPAVFCGVLALIIFLSIRNLRAGEKADKPVFVDGFAKTGGQ